MIIPNQVIIIADLDITIVEFGFLASFYIIINGVGILVFGYLTDIYSRKNLLVVAGIAWSTTAIINLFITTYWQLFLSRMIAGFAAAVTAPVAFSFMADVISSEKRSKAFAFWGLISTIGGLVAGSIALAFNKINYDALTSETVVGQLAEIQANYSHSDFITWRFPLFFLGFIALIFVFLNFLLTKEPKRGVTERHMKDILQDEDLQYSYKIKLSDLKYVFTRKSNFFLIMNLFDVIMSGLLLTNIIPYLTLEMGANFNNPSTLVKLIVLLLVLGLGGLVFGQFALAHWADKRVKGGELSGRVKVATTCSILSTPFLLIGFIMTPVLRDNTFFLGNLHVDEGGFWVLWIIFALILGIGLAFTMGIGPNWYSSLLDVNLPEHRGTMIAVASFVDAMGRAIGAIIGPVLVLITGTYSSAIFWVSLYAGIISLGFWLPLFYTSDKDFNEVDRIIKERAILMQKADKTKKIAQLNNKGEKETNTIN
jgi:MFS family permease